MENGSVAIGHKPPQAGFSAQRTQTSVPGAASQQSHQGELPFHPFFHSEIFPQINVCHCLQFLQSWWESCWLEAQHPSVPMLWGHIGDTLGLCSAVHGDPRDRDPTGGTATQSSHPKSIREQSQGAAAHSWLLHCCLWMSRAGKSLFRDKPAEGEGIGRFSIRPKLFQSSQTASRVWL